MTDRYKTATHVLAIIFLGAIAVSGCEQDGPMESVGEEIDESVEAAGDEVEEAADEVEDGIEEAEDEVRAMM